MRFVNSILGGLQGLARFGPSKKTLGRLCFVAGFVGCTAAAFWFGRQGAPQAAATTILPLLKRDDGLPPVRSSGGPYAKRVVAQIYGSTPVTREDLGEYLIERFGAERIEFLVNRRIVEKECAAHGIVVTSKQVEDQLDRDIQDLGQLLTREEFTNNILKRFKKTLYEWKEDVIRPKLALAALCRALVKVDESDLRTAYEIKFGPRVEVRLICFQKDDRNIAKVWEEARKSEERFSHYARNQFIHHLALNGGKVPAIHKHFPDADLERTAFGLKEGEVSERLKLKDGTWIVMKCDKIIPADASRSYESVRLPLEKELFNQKLAQKIPEMFNELRRKADPQIYLRPGDAVAARSSAAMARKDTVIDLPPPLPVK